MKYSTFVILLLIPFIAGCQRHIPKESMWEGIVELPENKLLAFRMHVDLTASPASGYFLVGEEKTPIPEIIQRGDSLIFLFTEYGAEMRAQWDGSKLHGTYFRFRSDTTTMQFSALTASTHMIPARNEATAVPPVGKYQVYFSTPGGVDSATVATFWVKSDTLYGTLIAPDGDYGLLVGQQFGKRVQLGRFTGWQATMIELNQSFGNWIGRVYFRKETPRVFLLEPLPTLPKEKLGTRKTAMKNPREPFMFSGITIEGDTLTQTDARWKGKALLIDIMGTWCHNCMDEAPVLQQLYSEFKDEGLEVIGLSFEIQDDLELAKKNLTMYRDRFGITFPLLYCGTVDEPNVQERILNQVTDFFAYPTSFFVGRDGRVQAIHVGFKGPGTGDEYQHQVQEFYEAVRKVLGENSVTSK